VTLGVRLIDGQVALQPALTVLLLTPELYAPLRSLAAQFHVSADGLAAAERILDVIASPEPGPGNVVPLGGWRDVRLEDVALANPGRGGSVLAGFELRIDRGDVVALIGDSGAGKSTVAALLLGLRAPDTGRVSVDGVDLATIDPAAWRSQVAWMPQRPTIFRGTVRDNIVLGNPGATEVELRTASELAGFARVAEDLPAGYDTVVGEGGRELSMGEARRLALARTLVSTAPLLILDEPTANLDPESAATIATSIRAIDRSRAVLLIAHDPEIARSARRIVRLDAGRALDADLPASAALP